MAFRVVLLLCAVAAVTGLATPVATRASVPDVVLRYFTSQNERNCTELGSLFNATFSVTDPHGSPPVTSLDALLAGCKGEMQTFSKVSLRSYRGWSAGTGTAIEWHCANVAPNPKGGKPCFLNFSGIDVFEVDEASGKIASMVGYFDGSLPQKQLQPCMS
eukprot:g4395.t1